MLDFVWSQGRIAWPPFASIVITFLLILAVDYAWRMVRLRSVYLALGGAAIWAVCIVLVWAGNIR